MKKMLIPFAALLISYPSFAEENCTDDNLTPSKQAERLAGENCDVVDKMLSCSEEVTIDPDQAQKAITSLFDRAEKGEFPKNWNHWKKIGSVSQLYDFGSDSKNPTPLLDWLTDENFSGTKVDKEEIKKGIIAKYVAFAKQNDCTPQIKHGAVAVIFPEGAATKTAAELKKITDTKENLAAKDAFFKEKNAKMTDTHMVCNAKSYNQGPWRKVYDLYPPCSGNITGLFKDNIANVSTLDQSVLGAETNELSQCIKDRMSKGAKIHHISIDSSASALNNTGDAAKRFCKKGFEALSQARAESARDKIIPQLFSKAGQENFDYSSKIDLNYKGANGDGTSGPCPYKIVNGKEVLKDQYKTAAGKKELDEAKFVKVQVTFEDAQKKLTSEVSEYKPHYYCKNIEFKCAPVAASAQ